MPARRVLRLVNDTGYPDPARPEGRLLALRCLGIPQVATRAPMSRRRALRYRLAAYCARIRPGTTAELASLVLRMGDEIDTRERMLDAALGVAGRGRDRADFDQAAKDAGCGGGKASVLASDLDAVDAGLVGARAVGRQLGEPDEQVAGVHR